MRRAPPDRGMLVIVVGASGVGKDSLLAAAREAFAGREDIRFQRRVVTRAADAANEPHESVDEATFERRRRAGHFAIDWQAHGLHYGIPMTTIDALAEGRVVVVNGSRKALPRFATRFPRRHIVHVTVSPETLARRLRARGRESEAAIAERLERRIDPASFDGPLWQLDNDGMLDDAAARLIDWLDALSRDIAGTASGARPAALPTAP